MDEYKDILWERRGRILTLKLNRPDSLNAFNPSLHREMSRVFFDAAQDKDSDIIILTGAGRAFSAGGDAKDKTDPGPFEIVTAREAKLICNSMLDCDKPIITKINGPAIGLGATVALFGDITFMARSAIIADPHVRVGLVAGDGGAVIWPQLIGYARAKEYLFTGDKISADEAYRLGLVNHVVDDDQLDAAVDAFADRLAAGAQRAIRWTKLTINVGLKQLAAGMLDAGIAYESVSTFSDDHKEAISAFRDNRKPAFGRENGGK